MAVDFIPIVLLKSAMVNVVRLVVSKRPLHGVVDGLNASITCCRYYIMGMVSDWIC